MSKNSQGVEMAQMYPLMQEMLESSGTVTFKVVGWSMQPMLYHRRDSVTIVTPQFPLKKYDLPFYRRDDGSFILHRIIKVNSDGSYVCRGDNQWQKEYGVEDRNIIGVVRSFTRDGKEYNVDTSLAYRFYTRTWAFFHHFKGCYKHIKPVVAKFKRNK